MKNKLTLLDIFTLCKELQFLVGSYLSNIYDLDSQNYLLKFNTKNKDILSVSLGKYMYIPRNPPTQRKMMPSSFCAKLRKHIKNKRLISFQPYYYDRVVKLEFGELNHKYYLIIDFISKGNIILTDSDEKIMAHVRSHTFDSENQVKVGVTYPSDTLRKDISLKSPDDFDNLGFIVGTDLAKEVGHKFTKDSFLEVNNFISDILNSCSGGIGYYSKKEVTPYSFYYINDTYTKYKSFNSALDTFINIKPDIKECKKEEKFK